MAGYSLTVGHAWGKKVHFDFVTRAFIVPLGIRRILSFLEDFFQIHSKYNAGQLRGKGFAQGATSKIWPDKFPVITVYHVAHRTLVN